MGFSSFAIALYFLASAILLVYAANAYFMVWACLRNRRVLAEKNSVTLGNGQAILNEAGEWPSVTTQIPLFNEVAVADRVIRAVAAMTYPKHDIQVLDDSTDETCAVVDRVAEELRRKGVHIEVIRRHVRTGYKAGALAEGLLRSQSGFLAIFDADFIPPPDFLLRTVPHLVASPRAGWVQARWGHLNEEETILTQAQAVGIDGHFAIDQGARGGGGSLYMNFNGTCGIWRRVAIEDAGGWTADTLTEDLDLSYRAQLRGWKGLYLPDVVVPGELPGDVAAFKSQQFRWAKGSIQTALKLAPALLRAKTSFLTKAQAWFHLTHYAIHPIILLFAATSMIMLWINPAPGRAWNIFALPVVLLSLAPTAFYASGQWILHRDWPGRLLRLPILILAGIGLAISNSIAVYEAVAGKTTPFHRTPKQGDAQRRCYKAQASVSVLSEVAAAAVCLATFTIAAMNGRGLDAQFLLLVGTAFLFISTAPYHRRLKRGIRYSNRTVPKDRAAFSIVES